ncbi:SurA N-terminal domain-containing protein, partial [Sphaerochaeta sp. S2]|uniref:SurA N-terminal domain-containing protein n=1 Tax=Sphaerochaeta sp. S2 TaxID=2798868 RepID=UPI0018E98569
MKKYILLLLMLFLVGCSNDPNEGNTNGEAETVVEEVKDTVANVNGEKISLETFTKYYAMQSYDFEKEYGEGVWSIEQDGKTMKEIRQEQTINYLVRISLVEKYIMEKGFEVDEAIIEEAYNKYMDSIATDEEIKAYFEVNDLDKTFLKRFLKDQYY